MLIIIGIYIVSEKIKNKNNRKERSVSIGSDEENDESRNGI